MPLPSCRLAVVALLGGSAVGLSCYYAGVFSLPTMGPGDLSALPSDVVEFSPTDVELAHDRQIVSCRIAAKRQVTQELLAGRLALNEAAARFREIERELPVTWGARPAVSRLEEDEWLCRRVMSWAIGTIGENSAAEPALVARLESELQQLRGPDGFVRLPD